MTLPDIAGSNAVVNIGAVATANGAARTTARWIQFTVSGSGTVRITNSSTPSPSTTFGLPVSATNSFVAPPVSQGDNPPPYNLNSWNAYVPAGATLTVLFEPYN